MEVGRKEIILESLAMADCTIQHIEKTQNHYTIVPAPIGIEPNIGKVLTTTHLVS